MQRQGDAAAVMEVIVSTAVAMVPGAEEASISLTQGRRRVVSAVATGELPRRFDDLQEETRQGPLHGRHVRARDHPRRRPPLGRRWPELARRIPEFGVASTMCFQAFVAGDDLGTLNLLARRPGAFTDVSERVGLLFASHAAVAVAQAQKVTHLNTALASRDVIGQAKGILMERYKITATQAFALLVRVSMDTNRRVHEVAEYLTDTGALATDR